MHDQQPTPAELWAVVVASAVLHWEIHPDAGARPCESCVDSATTAMEVISILQPPPDRQAVIT